MGAEREAEREAERDAARMPAPLVSVLLPCWNAEQSIERALASVLAERSVPLECIVVDDASTDGTAALVAAAAARDERVVSVRLDANEGVSNARNRGLEQVRGEWLTMLDADDRFLPGGLGALIRAATGQGGEVRAVVGQQVWSDGRRTWRTSLYDIPDIRLPGRTSLASRPGLLYYVSPHAKLFHRSCFEGLTFSGRVLGDQAWIVRGLLRAGDGIVVLADDVYEWFRPADGAGPPSITSTARTSATRSVEAAQVAIDAFRAVAGETQAQVDDARLDGAGRDAVLATYAARLLRSDLGVILAKALGRRDPGTAALIDAIAAFLRTIPERYLGTSPALARDVLEPLLRHWGRLDPASRDAYRRLVVGAESPAAASRRRRPVPARLGLAIGMRARGTAGHAVAAALLTSQWFVEGVVRRARRARGTAIR